LGLKNLKLLWVEGLFFVETAPSFFSWFVIYGKRERERKHLRKQKRETRTNQKNVELAEIFFPS